MKSEIQPIETLTPAEVAKVLHKNAEWVRLGLQQGIFSFGSAVKTKSGQWNYLIIKNKFLEYIGKEVR